ncbi:serine/threonine protein kinase [Agromyces laixinhei]|uniref:serine/threonine protein kinase n=1 Tax=Agromyces laixinhei TaxID=2585717 RepID=UPI00143D26CB|nr:serine/threonine-protein kinase [Agromyces laixinhei]
MSSAPDYPPGTVVNDRYEFRGKLGRDGSVYEAFDRNLRRVVAFKVLEPRQGQSQSWDEARRLEQLRSEFIVDVLNADVVINSDIRYIVTPLVPGGDLEQLASPVGVGLRSAVRFGQQIAAGIDRVHESNMLHRDVKPANVLLQGDKVRVSDLEYCIAMDEIGEAEPAGSWCSVAPEAAIDNGRCSVRSDIYSLGATVFYLLSGEYPVDHRLHPAEQRDRIVRGDIRELRELAPHVPQSVANVVRRAVRHDPNKRFDSALAFGNALATAYANAQDRRRVVHPDHLHCIELDGGTKAPVTICAVRNAVGVHLSARHSRNGRRVAGVRDRVVADANLASELRTLVQECA